MTPPGNLYRCITRIVINEPRRTRGWMVRFKRRGIAINEFYSDSKFGGKLGALSEAVHFRDKTARELRPMSRSELARRRTARNSSGIPGVRRVVVKTTKEGKLFETEAWEASGSPQPNNRKSRRFSVKKLGEDGAREAAISQRLRWEKQMESYEIKHPEKVFR